MIQRIIPGVAVGFIAAYLSGVTWRIITVSYSDSTANASPIIFFAVWLITIFLSINLSSARKVWRTLSYIIATLCMVSPAAWLTFTYAQVLQNPGSMYVTGGSAFFIMSFIVGWPLSLIFFFVGWLIGREKRPIAQKAEDQESKKSSRTARKLV